MPSSGYGIEGIFQFDSVEEANEHSRYITAITANAEYAMKMGMFLEWLDSFIAAYNQLKVEGKQKWEAANIASQAGIIEWDM